MTRRIVLIGRANRHIIFTCNLQCLISSARQLTAFTRQYAIVHAFLVVNHDAFRMVRRLHQLELDVFKQPGALSTFAVAAAAHRPRCLHP